MKKNYIRVFDKRVLEMILTDQKAEIEAKSEDRICPRKEVELIDLNSTQAQVVIGVRRSGKSTLCYQALKEAGVKFAYADFDDERLNGLQADQLNDVLETLYKIYGDFRYLFLDEIQNIEGWHLFANRMLRMKMHILVTGSNAKLLSSELATHLTGRSKEIHLYPFSFYEYCTMLNVDTESFTTKEEAFRRKAFDDYSAGGGFPELLTIQDTRSYVSGLVDNIIKRDIIQRYKISYKAELEELAQHLMNVSPTRIVTSSLAKMFHLKSEHTVKNYVDYLKQAFLLIGLKKFSPKSRVRTTQEKVYVVDVAMMNNRDNAFAGDNLGWRLETIVFLSLVRECRLEGLDLYYLDERSSECDFIVCRGNTALQAIQVSYDISPKKTLRREIAGLKAAAEVTGCKDLLLLTDHDRKEIQADGLNIRVLPVYEWCLRDSAIRQ